MVDDKLSLILWMYVMLHMRKILLKHTNHSPCSSLSLSLSLSHAHTELLQTKQHKPLSWDLLGSEMHFYLTPLNFYLCMWINYFPQSYFTILNKDIIFVCHWCSYQFIHQVAYFLSSSFIYHLYHGACRKEQFNC